MDFVEICNICVRKAIIKAAKRIINSDKMCRSYSDLNFGITFLEPSVFTHVGVLLTVELLECEDRGITRAEGGVSAGEMAVPPSRELSTRL